MIICSGFSGAIYYYADLPIVRWDGFADGKAKAFLEAASAQNRPLYAILWPYEVEQARLARMIMLDCCAPSLVIRSNSNW